jgi:hypothetical protein
MLGHLSTALFSLLFKFCQKNLETKNHNHILINYNTSSIPPNQMQYNNSTTHILIKETIEFGTSDTNNDNIRQLIKSSPRLT